MTIITMKTKKNMELDSDLAHSVCPLGESPTKTFTPKHTVNFQEVCLGIHSFYLNFMSATSNCIRSVYEKQTAGFHIFLTDLYSSAPWSYSVTKEEKESVFKPNSLPS